MKKSVRVYDYRFLLFTEGDINPTCLHRLKSVNPLSKTRLNHIVDRFAADADGDITYSIVRTTEIREMDDQFFYDNSKLVDDNSNDFETADMQEGTINE